ncbi:MAG: alpha/beta hydrolase, partial [Alphaproteobacteria bacterium]|nr:alpha/beta hydrolase [Alphaproteobacteria bacterium]
RRIGEPDHLVAHSFGGAVALAAILRGAVPIHSLAIFEAAVVSLLPQDSSGNAPDAFPTAARRTSDEFEMAHNRGEKDAVKIVIDYWGGEGAFDALPGAAQDYCRETAGSNVLDWRTVFGFTATDTDLATLTAPTLVVRGEHASPSMRAITQTLQDNLPNAQSTVVGGANHFLTATHAAACASVLLEFWNALPD